MLRDNFMDNFITGEPQVKTCLKTPSMIHDFHKLSIELHSSSKCGLESAVKPVPGKDGGGGDGGGDGDAGCVSACDQPLQIQNIGGQSCQEESEKF